MVFRTGLMTAFADFDDVDDHSYERDILGVRVSPLTRQEARMTIQSAFDTGRHLAVGFLNAHNANVAFSDPDYRACLEKFLVLADGIGIDMASKLLYGQPFPDNLNGTDFVPDLLASDPVSRHVALIGSVPGVAERAADTLRALAPQHHFEVLSDGYFDEKQSQHLLVALFQNRPDLLLVAMGTPRQEMWIRHNITSAHCSVVMGVGALLDFVGGKIHRAPAFVRRLRMEWVWRLALEPQRMFKRYVLGNPLFLMRVMRQKLAKKR